MSERSTSMSYVINTSIWACQPAGITSEKTPDPFVVFTLPAGRSGSA
ncbi:hypothetical protein V7x_23720 [Crateriforma conspicua]|uniref:Uncharacterized protein n=1 Tax=Crateriforma conspicua TaxID=2527996 RepID=A0A5C6FWH7_9PLAN|nr:hypothetical protein V7x_23720 [Crateriforma conspicua]